MSKILPKKHLGQNFLINENVKMRIIEACDIKKEDSILEIGPGLGALTEKIIEKSDNVFAVEKDLQLYKELQKKCDLFLKTHPDKDINLIHSDFLKTDLSFLPEKLKAIGNLPYNISSPIIEILLNNRNLFSSVFLTVQFEFAQRLAAKVNSKDYGSLSCFAQYYCDVKILFKIRNTSFFPVPKVMSCFVSLIPREPMVKAKDEGLLFKIIRSGFSQRRKKIINTLSSIIEKDRLDVLLKQLKIDRNLRAENLSLKDFVEIANCEVLTSKK